MRVKVRHEGWGMAAAEPTPEHDFFHQYGASGSSRYQELSGRPKAPIEVVPRMLCVCSSSKMIQAHFYVGNGKVLREGISFEKEIPSRTLPKKTSSGFFWF